MKAESAPGLATFEVSRNGKRVCTAGLRGKPGVLTAILHWVNRNGSSESMLEVGGLDSNAQEHLNWVSRRLRIGDEIIIRVLQDAKPTRVRSRQRLGDQLAAEHEKAWLRKAAKKYGYRLVRLGGSPRQKRS